MNKPHPHAALMADFASDAAHTETPWENWEYFDPGGGWTPCKNILAWNPTVRYRRKPRTIRIGDAAVPEPLRQRPAPGTTFYVAEPSSEDFCSGKCLWETTQYNERYFVRGLVHLTKDSAAAHGHALATLSAFTTT